MSHPFFITRPTASGKSATALALAERVGGEIVNADAFQLYQGLDLLTAKPPLTDRARVPHHLYDVMPPAESCDAQRYREMALPIIADIAARGRVPIVVGGSGLYIKALSHGLADLPRGDTALRAELNALPIQEMVEGRHPFKVLLIRSREFPRATAAGPLKFSVAARRSAG